MATRYKAAVRWMNGDSQDFIFTSSTDLDAFALAVRTGTPVPVGAPAVPTGTVIVVDVATSQLDDAGNESAYP